MDNDVRAGKYVAIGDQVKEGSKLRIDIYDVVVDHRMQMVADVVNPIELLESSSESDGGKQDRRVGGRFWVLADGDDDEDDDEGNCVREPPELYLPMDDAAGPSGESERQGSRADDKIKLDRRIVHRRTTASAIRPWKGSVPKVCLAPITLSDFWSMDSWTKITRKKKQNGRAAGQPPAPATVRPVEIQAAKRARLNQLLRQVGPAVDDAGTESDMRGYVAQHETPIPNPTCVIPDPSCDVPVDVSIIPPQELIARVRRLTTPGFPKLGAGRAARVTRPPGDAMVGRGVPPPEHGAAPPAPVPARANLAAAQGRAIVKQPAQTGQAAGRGGNFAAGRNDAQAAGRDGAQGAGQGVALVVPVAGRGGALGARRGNCWRRRA
ncbi:uncharacterized protein [Triticum aestivum]|uniref:uncharacterized protein isoform X2 n=1 Tax=Triticum aestivum TaxID=4565 RepID=UPI001D023848|nr:uncharacterized protein LOC123167815 isoform X2 [Triticum aestivum]